MIMSAAITNNYVVTPSKGWANDIQQENNPPGQKSEIH